MLDQKRGGGVADERRFAHEHLVRNDAQRVQVAPSIELTIARRLLGRHVRRSTDRHTGRRQARRFARVHHRAGDAEVGDERAPVDAVQQNVVGLDVTVDDTARMGVRERVGNLRDPPARVFDWQRPTLL